MSDGYFSDSHRRGGSRSSRSSREFVGREASCCRPAPARRPSIVQAKLATELILIEAACPQYFPQIATLPMLSFHSLLAIRQSNFPKSVRISWFSRNTQLIPRAKRRFTFALMATSIDARSSWFTGYSVTTCELAFRPSLTNKCISQVRRLLIDPLFEKIKTFVTRIEKNLLSGMTRNCTSDGYPDAVNMDLRSLRRRVVLEIDAKIDGPIGR